MRDSPISLAEVTKEVRKLFGSKVLSVDEIHPEMLKAWDSVGLSCLRHLFKVTWRTGTVPVGWQIGWWSPFSKKGDRLSRYCSVSQESLFQVLKRGSERFRRSNAASVLAVEQ